MIGSSNQKLTATAGSAVLSIAHQEAKPGGVNSDEVGFGIHRLWQISSLEIPYSREAAVPHAFGRGCNRCSGGEFTDQ
jgi:hypothetical protein